jgi:3-hydroxyacyl-CoA dehydrogenase
MAKEIKKVAVLGAGVMGSGIAAHLANAGIESYLLDLDGPTAAKMGLIEPLSEKEKQKGLTEDSPEFRNRLAQKGLDGALKAKPAAFFHKSLARRVTVGNYTDHSKWMGEVDWIIEVVAERLDIKKKVYENVEKHRQQGTIVTSNTSGLLLKDLVDGRSDDFKQCFLITHFFNPVRYMRLLEVVTGPDTKDAVTQAVVEVCSEKLGKGIVYAKDTPNFVANRIGVHGMMHLLKGIKDKGFSVEFVDKVLGKPIGRPMGPFRLTDLVGLDTVAHVAENTHRYCEDDEDRELFVVPDFVKQMIEKKLLGNKTKAGFYKVEKKEKGKKEILALDLQSLEYRPKQKVRAESLSETKAMEEVGERMRFFCEDADDEAAELVWESLSASMVYAANRVPEIADDIVNIDNAMKWGFNWKLGPFEMWDAIGVEEVIDRLEEDDRPIPELANKVMEKGGGKFYSFKDGRPTFFDVRSEQHEFIEQDPGVIKLTHVKKRGGEVKTNPGATLLDLGDGVFCVEFHTKMNSIDDQIIDMLDTGVEHAEQHGKALVIHNEGDHFSAGANIFLIAMLAQQKAFDKIGEVVEMFQGINMRLKYAAVPVVAAPFNYTFGGGCEISMAADAICGHAELYIGLVEVGVGLVPAGAGCSQFLLRAKKVMEAKRVNPGPLPISQHAFETIAFAKVATSAEEGRRIGYVAREQDRYVMDRAKVLGEAKKQALKMSEGYEPPSRPTYRLPGTSGRLALEYGIDQFVVKGAISEHDKKIGYHLARILSGGEVHPTDTVTEQDLLELEKEAFLSLCGEEKTLARIQHMLQKGKPLRN